MTRKETLDELLTSKDKLYKIYLRVQNNLDIVGDDTIDFIFDIKKDLEVLYLLKKTMSIFKDKNKDGEIVSYELVGTYDIYDKEDFNRIKDWLENDE